MKKSMEEKIIETGLQLKTELTATDIYFIKKMRWDPCFADDFIKFISLLNEAEEKKMYSAIKSALAKLSC